jgi:hypothetical protein
MDFTVEFYETEAGLCPVREFLEELRTRDPDDFVAVLAGLAKLRNRQYHRPPLSKSLGDGLFELRHVGKLNTRVLWFFARQRRIIAVHGIRNKGNFANSRSNTMPRKAKTTKPGKDVTCRGCGGCPAQSTVCTDGKAASLSEPLRLALHT